MSMTMEDYAREEAEEAMAAEISREAMADRFLLIQETITETTRLFNDTQKFIEDAVKRDDNPIWIKKYKAKFDKDSAQRDKLDLEYQSLRKELNLLELENDKLWTYEEYDSEVGPTRTKEQEGQSLLIYQRQLDIQGRINQIRLQLDDYTVKLDAQEDTWRKDLTDEKLKAKDERLNLVEKLIELQGAYNYTAADIAEEAGIDAKKVRRMLNGEQPLSVDDLAKIRSVGPEWAAVSEELVERALLPENQFSIKEVVSKLENTSSITPQHVDDPVKPAGGCPQCGNDKIGVYRTVDNQNVKGAMHQDVLLERTRECKDPKCGYKWPTYEISKKRLDTIYDDALKHRTNNSGIASLTFDQKNAIQRGAQDFGQGALVAEMNELVQNGQLTKDVRQNYTLMAAYPELVKSEWNYERNKKLGLDPEILPADSMMGDPWWTCPKGHEYRLPAKGRVSAFEKGDKPPHKPCMTCAMKNVEKAIESNPAALKAIQRGSKEGMADRVAEFANLTQNHVLDESLKDLESEILSGDAFRVDDIKSTPEAPEEDEFDLKLTKLKRVFDKGLIDKDEYKETKADILKSI